MERVTIIAEAGVNHNGDMNIAKKLIDAAVYAGADFVKFQTFKTENLVTKAAKKAEYQQKNTNESTESQFEMLKKLELNTEQHHELISYCKTKNIQFLSTAFDLESVDLLDSLGMTLFKIPSGEITNLPYLIKIGKLNKKVIVSTGMCVMSEINEAIEAIVKSGTARNNISILHCTTAYPTPFEDVNLKALLSIKDELNINVGYSDHTIGIEVPVAAVVMGATIIEKHFTLDKNLPGPDHKASLEPEELKTMVEMIRNIESAISGNGCKVPSASENKNIIPVRKSLYFKSDLKMGSIITAEDFITLRPSVGISPMRMFDFVGKKLKIEVKKNQIVTEDIFL